MIGQQVSAVLKDPPPALLSPTSLCAYNGTYELTVDIRTTLQCTSDGLAAERAGRPVVTYIPEIADVFFVRGQPRTRRMFEWDATGDITGFDRRDGEDVRWRKVR